MVSLEGKFYCFLGYFVNVHSPAPFCYSYPHLPLPSSNRSMFFQNLEVPIVICKRNPKKASKETNKTEQKSKNKQTNQTGSNNNNKNLLSCQKPARNSKGALK